LNDDERAHPDPEVDAFMENNGRTIMVTRRKDGSPTAHPMAGFYGEGRLYLNMYHKSLKHRNLQRDPRITCLVTTPSDQDDFRAVVYRGRARMLSIEETLAEDAPLGVQIARVGSMEGALREGGDTDRFASEDPDDIRKRAKIMVERISKQTRILWEVVPDQAEFLDQVRDEAG
jgi:Pyridoxamine 5'-phosphate oxidase